MNNFELEDFLIKSFQEVKPVQETEFEVQDKLMNPEITGGKELENKDSKTSSRMDSQIETFEAKVTRPVVF